MIIPPGIKNAGLAALDRLLSNAGWIALEHWAAS